MKNGFVMRRRVEFMDTDMAGIVHFTAYFRYMETAEHELFRSLDAPTFTESVADTHRRGWPRVSCGFDFTGALRFGDAFEVHLGVTRIGKRSLSFEAEIVRDGTVLARGRSTSVHSEIDANHAMRSVDIPTDLALKLQRYKEETPT